MRMCFRVAVPGPSSCVPALGGGRRLVSLIRFGEKIVALWRWVGRDGRMGRKGGR